MKFPRDIPSEKLVKALEKLGYIRIRQDGSHMRLGHPGPPQHRITIPVSKHLKTGTMFAIVTEAANHLKIDKDEILELL